MQAQARKQQVQTITSQQSLAVVKTLLTASFGCIAYLRNLLPDNNFGEASLTSGERGASHGPPSQLSATEGQNVSKVHVRKVIRGVSTEADKLLNYLEGGVFQAIEKQYLKTCIIAIYLDSDDPMNIIEAYTYNFSYHTIPGTNTTVPVMTLDNQLNNMSINGNAHKTSLDPVARATKEGRAPTLGDVKQSLKNMVRNVIMVTQTMEPLPKHRFATFKLVYNDNAPSDYEPPHFRPGDVEKDRFVFSTHSKSERPERFSVGSLKTPHHGVDLQIQSVVKYIPNGEDDDTQFAGMIESTNQGATKRRVVDANARSRQTEMQVKDAEERTVVWDLDDDRWADADAEGSPDPDYPNDSGVGLLSDLPLASEDIRVGRGDDMETEIAEVQFYGQLEEPPSRVGRLDRDKSRAHALQATQIIEQTQKVGSSSPFIGNATHDGATQGDMDGSIVSKGVDTQMLRQMVDQQSREFSISDDQEMLDLETQQTDFSSNVATSYSLPGFPRPPKTSNRKPSPRAKTCKANIDDAECACGSSEADDLVQCDGPCNKWLHLWCMGFHSDEDSALPKHFICWPCRLEAEPTFELFKEDYPTILFQFEKIARFRRAIKLAEKHNPESLKAFRTIVGGNANVAEQLFKELENEGFIEEVIIETDSLGLMETKTRQTRSHKKKAQSTRTTKYAFVKGVSKTERYRHYFSPGDMAVEKDLLKIPDVEKKFRNKSRLTHENINNDSAPESMTENSIAIARRNDDARFLEDAGDRDIDMETQTQDDTQYSDVASTHRYAELKRRNISHETVQAGKKMKISVGDGVDLED